jgi:AraC-like DNA-binding protein
MTAAAGLVRAVLRTAAADGMDVGALLSEHGLDPSALEGRDARVPTERFLSLFATAAERSRDPAFGASVARRMDSAAFGLLGFVVASCPTLREALARFGRYARLLCDELRFDTIERGAQVAVVYAVDASPHVPALFEMAITHLVTTARRGTAHRFAPVRVLFRHQAAPRTLPTVLAAPVEFGAVEDAVLCDQSSLDLPLRGANPALLDVLESHVALVLESAPAPVDDEIVARARRAVRLLLPDGEPSLTTVARRLALGERTLQRRLREEGLTFRALVDDVRHECAKAQLANPEVSVAEVAYSLGFSSASAFHHAYRRWTGASPGSVRAR